MTDKIYQGEPPDTELNKTKKDRARSVAAWCVALSSDHYDPLRRAMDDWYDRYTNQPLKLRQTNRIRSNVPSGIVPEMIDSIRADMMDKIFKKRPYFPAIAREPDDLDSARLIEALHQFDFDQMKMWQITDINLMSACLWGSGLAKMGFETRTIKAMLKGVMGKDGRPQFEDVIGYQGPVIENAFIYEVFPHPSKVHPDDYYPISHITYESYDKLEDLAEAGVYDMEEVSKIPDKAGYAYDEFSHAVPYQREDMFERADQRARMGWTTDSRFEADGVMLCETECMFRHKESEPPVRTIVTIANGCVIRCEPGPLRDGSSVWLNGKILNVPGQFYGMSLVQKNKPQVHVAEVTLNMGLQNLAIAVNRQKIIRPDLVMNPSSFDDTPNGNIFAKPNAANLDNVVKALDPVSVAEDVFRFYNLGKDAAQGVSSNTDLKAGRVMSGETSATETNRAFSQASIRFKHMLGWYGESFLIPCNDKMLAYNRDYLSEPFVLQVTGRTGTHWQEVTQSKLAVNVDFVFLGPNREDDENLAVAQLENFFKIVSPLQERPWAQTVLQDLVVFIADKMNYPDMEMLKERMGYGKPIQPPMEQASTAGGPSKRQDRRIGQPNGAPTNSTQMAKSLGALLGGGGGGIRA